MRPNFVFRLAAHLESGFPLAVQLLKPVFAEAATLTEITVDVDVNANFVIQGDPETPAGIQRVLFTPLLVEIEP